MKEDKRKAEELAQKAAVISIYSIINPLADFFEAPFEGSAEKEKTINDLNIGKNGTRMHDYIETFIEEFWDSDKQTREEIYSSFRKHYEAEMEKYIASIERISGKDLSGGLVFNQFKDDEDNICIVIESKYGEKRRIVLF